LRTSERHLGNRDNRNRNGDRYNDGRPFIISGVRPVTLPVAPVPRPCPAMGFLAASLSFPAALPMSPQAFIV
jgi:hypothetical protein